MFRPARPRLRARWAAWPLWLRFTFIVTALVILTATLSAALNLWQEQKQNRRELVDEGTLLLSTLEASWADNLYQFDVDSLRDEMGALSPDLNLTDVRVFDRTGRLLADLANSEGARFNVAPDPEGQRYLGLGERFIRWESDTLLMAEVVEAGSTRLGAIEVRLSTAAISAANAAERNRLIMAAAGLTVFGAVAALLFSRSITRRLRELRGAAALIAAGHFSTRAPLHGADEVAALTQAFNTMAETVEHTLGDLENERSKLATIAESLQAGLLIIDAAGRVSFLNQRLGSLIPGAGPTLLGAEEDTVLECVRAAAEDSVAGFADLPAGRRDTTIVAIPTAVATRYVEVTLFPVQPPTVSAVRGYIFTNVTYRYEVDRMKSEFVALASHELRTPMTAIYGFASLLALSTRLPAEEQRWAQHIQTESERLTAIVEDLLTVSKIEAGTVQPTLEPVAFEEVMAVVAQRFATVSDRHEVSASSCADAVVLSDRDKLVQILSSLVDNAIKYSPAGGAVRIACERRDGFLLVHVSDEGLGIPAADVPRLFTRFHRIERAGLEQVRSTGLGLYLVKSLVQALGGEIGVATREGRGSTFTIRVPLATSAETLIREAAYA